MTAIIEDTWSGLDDIWMSMHGDVCHPSSTDCYRIGDFDGGHNKPVTTYSLFRKFTSNIFPYAYEDVDDNEGFRLDVGDWYEANRVISPLGWSGSGGPGTNGSWTGEQDDSDSTPIEYYQDPKDDTDYHYNFAYKRVKEKPSCTGKQDSSGNPCPFSTSCQHGHCCPDGVGCGY